jgi:uncharacterized membrane protein
VRRLRGDDGSILPLTIFYGVLSLLLVLLVVSATSLYLERKRLFTLADGAALVGAESYDLADVTDQGGGRRVDLDSADVASAVDEYVADYPGARFERLAVERAGSDDGRSATVSLSSYWAPPLLSLLVPSGIRIEVTAVARSVFE